MLGKTAGLLALLPCLVAGIHSDCRQGEGSLYDFNVPALDGSRNVSFSDYAGKAVLLINVATYWGIARQYPDYNALVESYNGMLDIVGVPCSQFFNQEPGSPEEIMNALAHVRPGNGFVPNFTLLEKSEVNGVNRMPLYDWVLNMCDSPMADFSDKSILMYQGLKSNDIRWNFEKILFNTAGQPVKRYPPGTEVDEIIPDIEALLSNRSKRQ